MCVIVYKKENVNPPSQEILANCWDNNKDGAGIMVRMEDKILLKKGFMKKDELLQETEHLAKNFPGSEYAIHFRIGTSGSWDRACTHPFPITQNVKKLKKTFQYAKGAVMHNGILGQGENDLSDSQVFVRDVLANCYNMLYKKNIRAMVESITKGNRLLIMLPNETLLTGTWIKKNDIYYSNSTYKKRNYVQFSSNDYQLWRSQLKYLKTDRKLDLKPEPLELKKEVKEEVLCDFCDNVLELQGSVYLCPECFNEFCVDCGQIVNPNKEICDCQLDYFDYKEF